MSEERENFQTGAKGDDDDKGCVLLFIYIVVVLIILVGVASWVKVEFF